MKSTCPLRSMRTHRFQPSADKGLVQLERFHHLTLIPISIELNKPILHTNRPTRPSHQQLAHHPQSKSQLFLLITPLATPSKHPPHHPTQRTYPHQRRQRKKTSLHSITQTTHSPPINHKPTPKPHRTRTNLPPGGYCLPFLSTGGPQLHHSSSGTESRTEGIWAPQPNQVTPSKRERKSSASNSARAGRWEV